MKKILSVFVMALFAIQMTSAQQVTTQEVNQLPATARTFINQNFANTAISRVKVDNTRGGDAKYEVMLANGAEIKFDNNGDWKAIETNQMMPSAIVPGNVGDYVRTNYASQRINKIKKDGNEIKVELNNNVKLKFDKDGRFMRTDD